MARYGGQEDYDDVLGKLGEAENSIDRLVAKEKLYEQELDSSAAASGRAGAADERKLRVRKETRDVVAREAAVSGESAAATNVDTAAIERNTAARRRQSQEAQRAAINWRRAFAGAQDPQFGAAYGIGGAQTTQYRIRQQLGGVGSRRAGAIQEALRAGIQPDPGGGAARGALTRLEAATAGVAAADVRYERARREYTNTIRRKSATEEEAGESFRARETARQSRISAQTELQAATAEAEAKQANAAAIVRETAAREQATQATIQEARQKRTAIEAGPIGTTGRQPFGLLPAAGQTAQMPLSPFTIQRARPGAFREIGFGGQVGGAVEPAYVRPSHIEERSGAQARSAAESAQATAQENAQLRERQESLARNALATGRASEAAHIYANVLDDEGRAMMAMRQAHLENFLAGNAREMESLGRTTRNAGIEFYTFDQSMHRHGALTSEFIAAAARGETTLREMGNQAVITAGKFGGWTLAASAVYGVVGALSQVGKGAMDASSGVDQAFRVITSGQNADALSADFSQLAGRFNVPIDQAADAVYRMGQVFHDQEDAVKASEAALYSFKTGEVDVATSTKNLIAIVNGFQLSAGDLGGVYDQINQAQNTFGISIGDTEAGLAKAAGTYRNAGGDLNYLLGLFIAIQKATGRPGTEIGTGLARAVQRIREPGSQAKLAAQGIEVDPQNFQRTLQRAFRAVARDPGIDIQEVATGLFGNQYARLITPVLADQNLLNRALKDTSPEASKGSAQRELARVLGQVDEQITAIGIHLQQLGESLARAGAFTFAGLLLRGLNESLVIALKILDVFNALPAPLRTAVVLTGQMALGLGALRRLGATERLGFLAAPEQRLRTHTVAGLRTAQQQSYNEIEGAARRQQRAALDREVATVNAAKFERERAPLLRQANLAEADRIRITNEGLAVEQELLTTERKLAAASARLEAERAIATTIEADLAAAQRTAAGAQFRTFMRERGLVAPRELTAPNLQGVASEAAFPGAVVPGGGGGIQQAEQTARRAEGVARQEAESARRTRTALTGAAAQLDLMGAALIGATGAGRGGATRGIGRAMQGTATRFEQAANFIGGAVGSARRLPGAMARLAASLGPLDIILGAFIGFELLGDKLSESGRKMDDAYERVSAAPRSAGEVTNKQKELQKVIDDQGNYFKDLGQTLLELLNPRNLAGVTFGKIGIGPEYTDPRERRDLLREAAQAEQDVGTRLAHIQANQRAAGGPVQEQTAGQVIAAIQKTQADREAGLISLGEFDRQMANHAIEIHTAVNANKQTVALMKLAQAQATSSLKGYREAIAGLDPEILTKNIESLLAQAGGTGMTPQILRRLRANYGELVNQLAGSDDADKIIALGQARDAMFDGLQKAAEADIRAGLSTARGEQGRRQVYSRVTTDTLSAAHRTVVDLRKKRDDADKSLGEARDRQSLAQAPQLPAIGETTDTAAQAAARLHKRLDDAKKDVANFAKNKKKYDQEYRAAKRKYNELKAELDKAGYEDRAQGREITLAYRQSRTADPAAQNRLAIQNAKRQVDDAAKTFGENSRQYRQAMTTLNNARLSAAQQILANVDAENALLLARAGTDPAAQARAQVQAETNKLNAMLRQPSRYDPNAIKQQRAAVINANNQQRDQARQEQQQLTQINADIEVARAGDDPVAAARAAIRVAGAARRNARTRVERAQALLDWIRANNQLEQALRDREEARTDLLLSQTEDPVEQARIEKDAARRAIAGTHGTERLRRRADYNRKSQAYRNALIDSQVDDLNFNLEMGTISNDIAAKTLEDLAKTKGISKQKKRELLLQAKRLRDEAEGDYELDIGNIRLPTLYEVRRYVMQDTGGSGSWNSNVTDNRTFNVNISTAEGANAFAQQLELTNGTSARATARSARIR